MRSDRPIKRAYEVEGRIASPILSPERRARQVRHWQRKLEEHKEAAAAAPRGPGREFHRRMAGSYQDSLMLIDWR